VHPHAEQEGNFEKIFAGRGKLEGGVVNLAVLVCCIEDDFNFLRKKCTREKILAAPMHEE